MAEDTKKLCHPTQIEDIPEKGDDELLAILYNSAETGNFTADEQNKYIDTMTTESMPQALLHGL